MCEPGKAPLIGRIGRKMKPQFFLGVIEEEVPFCVNKEIRNYPVKHKVPSRELSLKDLN